MVPGRVAKAAALAVVLAAGVVPAAGSAPRAWHCGGKMYLPAGSHDSRELAFHCDSGTNLAVGIVDVKTGRARRLVSGLIDGFSWSPNGRRIVYGNTGVFTIRADGTQRRRIVANPWAGFPVWSPDAREVLYENAGGGGQDHWLSVPAGGGTSHSVAVAAFSSSPAWSPDSAWVAFERAVGAGPGHPASGSQIAVVRRSGKGLRVVTSGDGNRYAPAWSPNGRVIAFEHDGFVEAIRVDGSGRTVLTKGLEPQFAPSGKRILFSGPAGLATIGTDGAGLRALTHDDGDSAAVWSPDGRLVAFVRDSSVWTVHADGTHARRVA